jgi:protein-tyrosine phosphatase
MAEVLFKKRITEAGLADEIEVLSAGTCALEGFPASRGAYYVANRFGLSLEAFVSQPLTRELCESANLIIVMEQAHLDWIQVSFPEAVCKTVLLGELIDPDRPQDVPDPISAGEHYFIYIAKLLNGAFDKLIEDWTSIRKRYQA